MAQPTERDIEDDRDVFIPLVMKGKSDRKPFKKISNARVHSTLLSKAEGRCTRCTDYI
jgi:hypothetical protein